MAIDDADIGAVQAKDSNTGARAEGSGSRPQPVGTRILNFMQRNPTAWRANTLAARLKIGIEPVRRELSRLEREGILVSCVVTAHDRRPQGEYRIAAYVKRLDARNFVISRPEKSRAAKAPAAGSRPARKRTR